jgi:hypothetical protein
MLAVLPSSRKKVQAQVCAPDQDFPHELPAISNQGKVPCCCLQIKPMTCGGRRKNFIDKKVA